MCSSRYDFKTLFSFRHVRTDTITIYFVQVKPKSSVETEHHYLAHWTGYLVKLILFRSDSVAAQLEEQNRHSCNYSYQTTENEIWAVFVPMKIWIFFCHFQFFRSLWYFGSQNLPIVLSFALKFVRDSGLDWKTVSLCLRVNDVLVIFKGLYTVNRWIEILCLILIQKLYFCDRTLSCFKFLRCNTDCISPRSCIWARNHIIWTCPITFWPLSFCKRFTSLFTAYCHNTLFNHSYGSFLRIYKKARSWLASIRTISILYTISDYTSLFHVKNRLPPILTAILIFNQQIYERGLLPISPDLTRQFHYGKFCWVRCFITVKKYHRKRS